METYIFNTLIIISGLLALSFLVFVHELGHFLVAKYFKIRVISFAIGFSFGKSLYEKEWRGTVYKINPIPFGGYVHMAGEHPDDNRELKDDEFMSKPVWQRILVAFAGPAVNIIVAFLTLWFLYIIGAEEYRYLSNTTVGYVAEKAPLGKAGMTIGDSIVAINERSVVDWREISTEFLFEEDSYKVDYVRNGVVKSATVKRPEVDDVNPATFGIFPPAPALIGSVQPKSPAEQGNLQKADKILAINGTDIVSWMHFSTMVQEYDSIAKTPLAITVLRENQTKEISLHPKWNDEHKRFLIGVGQGEDPNDKVIRKFTVGGAFVEAYDKSVYYSLMVFRFLEKIFTGKVALNQLSGPTGIVTILGGLFLNSFREFLSVMGMIGLNLAIMNLIPIFIITDGGVIVLALLEAIRKKPLSVVVQERINKVATMFFLAFFVLITFFDFTKLGDMFRAFGR